MPPLSDDDPLFGYVSCPRCDSSNLARSETPARSSKLEDGATLKLWSRVVLCTSCGEVVYEKQLATRIEPIKETAKEKTEESKEEEPKPGDRFKLLDVD